MEIRSQVKSNLMFSAAASFKESADFNLGPVNNQRPSAPDYDYNLRDTAMLSPAKI